MEKLNTQYNIPEPDSIFGGSYSHLEFKIFDELNSPMNLRYIPKITFSLCKFGQYENCIISFNNKDNTEFKPRIVVDSDDSSLLNVYLYPDDTLNLQSNYYDFQIVFESHDSNYTSVAGQGKIRIHNKIK